MKKLNALLAGLLFSACVNAAPVPISNGGTNTSAQITNGVTYFNSGKITSDTIFHWDGAYTLSLENQGAPLNFNITNFDDNSLINLMRGNDLSKRAGINYSTYLGGNGWFAGLYPAAAGNEFVIRNLSTSANALFIDDSTNAITLPALSASKLVSTNASKQLVSSDLSGDITSSGLTTTLANNVVTNAKLRQSAALSIIGNSTNATANAADISASLDGQVLRQSSATLGFGALNLTSSNAVTGILPNANTTAASSNTASAIVSRDGSGNFSAGTISGVGANFSGLAASYPVVTDGSKNLSSANVAASYAFGTTNPASDANADTVINVVSSTASKTAQLNVAPNGLGSFFSIFSGRTTDTNPSVIWSTGNDLRFGTATAGQLQNSGYSEKFRMGNNGDFTLQTGNLILSTIGKTTSVKTGTNACTGNGATLSSGSATITTTCATVGSIILLMKTTDSGTSVNGAPAITISSGVSFTITKANDASTYSWYIVHTF